MTEPVLARMNRTFAHAMTAAGIVGPSGRRKIDPRYTLPVGPGGTTLADFDPVVRAQINHSARETEPHPVGWNNDDGRDAFFAKITAEARLAYNNYMNAHTPQHLHQFMPVSPFPTEDLTVPAGQVAARPVPNDISAPYSVVQTVPAPAPVPVVRPVAPVVSPAP